MRGDLMLHAAGAVGPSGRAHLVLGKTGAGKSTTVAGLVSAGWTLLDDDGIRIVETDDGPVGDARDRGHPTRSRFSERPPAGCPTGTSDGERASEEALSRRGRRVPDGAGSRARWRGLPPPAHRRARAARRVIRACGRGEHDRRARIPHGRRARGHRPPGVRAGNRDRGRRTGRETASIPQDSIVSTRRSSYSQDSTRRPSGRASPCSRCPFRSHAGTHSAGGRPHIDQRERSAQGPGPRPLASSRRRDGAPEPRRRALLRARRCRHAFLGDRRGGDDVRERPSTCCSWSTRWSATPSYAT